MSTALHQSEVVRPAGRYARDIDIIRVSIRRSLLARYRGTAFGVLWSFGNPLIVTLLYTALFGTAFSKYYGSIENYLFSAFVGVLVATFFQQTTAEALVSVVTNGGLLNKISLKSVIFPLASVGANAFQQAVTSVPVLILVAIFIGRDPLRLALLPIVLLAIIAFTTGVSLLLATAYVFFRDLPHLWGTFSFLLWMTSPVFYPSELVPGSVRPVLQFNPLAQCITAARDIVIGHGPLHYRAIAATIVWGIVALAAGLYAIRARAPRFADLL